MKLPAYTSIEHSDIVHEIMVADKLKSNCDVKIGNLQGLKAGSDVLLDILDKMNW